MRYLGDLLGDGRIAFRALAQQKLFAAMAILSMTIGIGANTAIFTVANALLFRGPAGVTDTDRLVDIGAGREDGGLNPTSFPHYVAVRDRAQSFDGVYARQMFLRALTVGAGNAATPERGYADFVTLNYFTVLGLRPAAGRLFASSDPQAVGASPIAVVSYPYWSSRLNRSQDVVGQTIRLNGRPYWVRQRTQEIGIRMALGATAPEVQRLVLRHAGAVLGIGLVVGAGRALMLGRWLCSLAFLVCPSDPACFLPGCCCCR
jgi:ABC-type antimicrobial peptide transport system permease subunit